MQRVSIFFVAVFITLLATGSRAFAQEKAPEFSNDLMMGDKTYLFLIADRLEYSSISGANPLVWDAQGYLGNSINRFWFKTEGEALTTDKEGEMEFQGLYSRAIGPYFDLQTGFRYDVAYDRSGDQSRAFGVIGFQGLAPYFFEIDGALFVSEDGDISASLEAEYDLLFTQRLIGQPRISSNLAVQEVEKWGVGSGFNDIQLGFRLRYEIKREFAPYIGFSWNRKLGEKADFTRSEGEEVGTLGLVGGVRMWF